MAQGNPKNVLTWNSLGEFHRSVGNANEASACFDKAIEVDSSYAAAYWNASEFTKDHEASLKRVKALIAGTSIAERDLHYLHFSAYRHCEKLAQYDDAFEHLQIANGLKRRAINYDVNAELEIDNNAKRIFTPNILSKLDKGLSSKLRPIFIILITRSC